MPGTNEKDLKLRLLFEVPNASAATGALQNVGKAAADAQTQAQKMGLAFQDAQKQAAKIGTPGGPMNPIDTLLPVIQGGLYGRRGLPSQITPGAIRPGSSAIQSFNPVRPWDAKGMSEEAWWAEQEKAKNSGGPGEHGKGKNKEGGEFLPFVGKKVAALAGVAVSITSLIEAIAALHNPMATTNQRIVEAAKAVPILGGALGELTESIQKSIERIEDWEGSLRLDQMKRDQPRILAEGQARSTYQERAQGLAMQQHEAASALAATQKFPNLGFQSQGLAAAGGFGVFGSMAVEDPRVREAKEAAQMARRELSAAEEDAKHAQEEFNKEHGKTEAAKKGAAAAIEQAEGLGRAAGAKRPRRTSDPVTGQRFLGEPDPDIVPGEGESRPQLREDASWSERFIFHRNRIFGAPEPNKEKGSDNRYQEALFIEQRKILELERQEATLAQSAEKSKEKALSLAQKRYDLEKATTGIMKAELAVTREREAKAHELGATFGAMDTVSQRGALDALERFKSGGIHNVTADELSQIRSLPGFGEKINQTLAKNAGEDPNLKRLMDLYGLESESELNKKGNRLETEINAKMQFDDEQFRKLMKETLDTWNGTLTGIFKSMLLTELNKHIGEWARGAAGIK